MDAARDRTEHGIVASHRTVALPALGASYGSHEVLHPSFRVRVVRSRGLAVDEILLFPHDAKPQGLAWSGPSSRPRLSIVLEGRAEIRVRGRLHALAEGDMLLVRHLVDLTKRLRGGSATMLACDWELGSLGTRIEHDVSVGRLDAEDLRALRAAADSLCAEPPAKPGANTSHGRWLGDVLARLRATGAPFDAVAAPVWRDGSGDPAQRLLRAVDAALSMLGDRPMSIDLETSSGKSRWQLRREIESLADRYALNGATWRDLRQRWRLGVGFFLMSAPGATTEGIARALGYGSPIALCRAFADAGLPSPAQAGKLANRT